MRAIFDFLTRKRGRARLGAAHYASLAAQARRPELYERLGVADTFDGRFDMIVLHAARYLKRMRAAGKDGRELAQATFDAMFANIDQALREEGIGDTGLSKRIKAMVSGFYGRAAAYDTALAQAGDEELAEAIRRNVFAGADVDPAQVAAMSCYTRALANALDAAGDEEILSNRFRWPDLPQM